MKLNEICKINSNSYSKKDSWNYVNYLDTGNITRNDIDEIQYIDLKTTKLPSRAKRKVKRNSIVYSTVRPNQEHFGIIKTVPDNFLVSTGFAVLDVNEMLADSDYIYYFLSQKEITDRLHAIAEQSVSAYPSLKPSDIGNIEIDLPSVDNQRKISNILKVIDKKLKLNNEINNNLEKQAQTLFKAWFVDFEAFSGEMPIEWAKAKFGDIVNISTRTFSPAKNPKILVEHYSIPAFDENKYPIFETSDGIKSNKYILSPNSVLISKLNPDTKRVWRPYCLSSLAISSTEFIVFEPKNPIYRDFIYSIVDSVDFSNHMTSHTSGSTNSRQRTMPKTTLDYEFIFPTRDIIQQFCELVTPMYDMIQANIIENQSLVTVRDNLLPKLMSGEIDVSELDI